MKKPLLLLGGLVAFLSLALGGVANAQLMTYDIFSGAHDVINQKSYARLLNEYDNSWWYSAYDNISWEIKDGVLTAESLEIVDSDIFPVPLYRVILSPYRVSALKKNDQSVDLSAIIVKDVNKEDDSSNVVTFTLWAEDGLDPEVWYYGFVVPINDFDVVWAPSREMCFQLSTGIYEWDEGCDAFDLIINPVPVYEDPFDEVAEIIDPEMSEDEHGAAGDCVGMEYANISHVINWNEITLTWTSIPGDTVEVAILDPEDKIYRSLGTAKMSDEKFKYTMQWDGEQNFMLTNGICKEVFYKADGKASPTPVEPKTIVPAATWPAENVLYILIATAVLYGSYVLLRKSEDR